VNNYQIVKNIVVIIVISRNKASMEAFCLYLSDFVSSYSA